MRFRGFVNHEEIARIITNTIHIPTIPTTRVNITILVTLLSTSSLSPSRVGSSPFALGTVNIAYISGMYEGSYSSGTGGIGYAAIIVSSLSASGVSNDSKTSFGSYGCDQSTFDLNALNISALTPVARRGSSIVVVLSAISKSKFGDQMTVPT